MTPRTSSGNRKIRGIPTESKRNPKRFHTPRVPPGTRDGYGMGRGRGALPAVPTGTVESREAAAAWQTVLAVYPAAAAGWLGRLRCVGKADTALVVAGPPDVVSWIRRRHARPLAELVRSETRFTGLHVCVADPARPQPVGVF